MKIYRCISGRSVKILWYSAIFFAVLSTGAFNCEYPLLSGLLSTDSALFAVARADTVETPAASSWPHERSDLKPDPAVVFGKLPNGFRYILMHNREPKNRVSMHLYVQAGSLHETTAELGAAHFLEHMMFNGSTNFTPGELVKFFQRIGMQFGPDANAHTGFDETVYDILLPDGGDKSLEEGLRVFDDYARGALLLPSEIDRERKVVLAEMRSRDSASYRTFVATMKFEYPDMRLSRRFPIGTVESLKKTDRSVLKGFYDAWYRPDKLVLIMVGDFDITSAESLIKARFSDMIPRSPARESIDPGTLHHAGVKPFYHFEVEAGQTTVTLETLKHHPWQGDSFDFQRKMVLRYMAHQMVQNRLNAMINKKAAPFTSAWVGSGVFLKEIDISRFTAECAPEHWRDTLGTMEKTLRQVLTFGFFQSELDRVKRDYLSMLDNAVKAAATRDSSEIARQILRQVGEETVFQSPLQDREIFGPVIQEAALEEINRIFRASWPETHRLVLVTGNARMTEGGISPEALISTAYEESRHIRVAKPDEALSPPFPYLPIPRQEGKIARKERTEAEGVVTIMFENGVRLNLKKTHFKTNQVLVNLHFGHGRSAEPADKPGLADLSTSVFNESGVGALTDDELDAALAGKSTKATLSIREDGFVLNGETVTEELELLFQLLYTHVKDPAFRPEAFNLSMARFDQDYTTLSKTVDGALKLSVYRFLAGGDSRFGLPSRDRFHTLTLDDIRHYLLPPLQTAPLEISVAGDFAEDKVISLASRYFGTLEARPEAAPSPRSDMPAFPVGDSLHIAVPTRIPKALVLVAYPTADFWDIQRTRRMNVLADIFSERLREEIRERLGAAYSPFAYNRPGRAYKNYGAFQALVFVDPEQAEMVAAAVLKIAVQLAMDGVNAEALERAIEPALTEIRDMRRTNEYWLNSVMTGSGRHPEQLDWSRTLLKDFAAITTAEISSLAKQYLVDEKAATVIIRPEPED